MPALRMTMRLWIGMVVLLMLGCSVRRMHAQAMTTASGGGSYVSVGGGMTAMQTQYGRRVIAGRDGLYGVKYYAACGAGV